MKKVMTVLMVLGICAVSVQAADISWTGTGTTDWHTATNWCTYVGGNPASVPTASDFAYVDNFDNVGSPTECIIDSAAVADRVYVANGRTGELTVTNATLAVSAIVFVGNNVGSSGILNIEAAGTVTSGYTFVGELAGSTGAATVTGTNSTLMATTMLSVGASGSGTMDITAGGGVSTAEFSSAYNAGSTGEVTVDGSSTLTSSGNLHAGRAGNGTLDVTDGGVVTCDNGYIGRYLTSIGELTVDGAGSKLASSGNLIVSDYVGSSGRLYITGNGLVSVGGTLTIEDVGNGGTDGFVNMKTGGMLALLGDADDNLAQFLGLVGGSDDIQYWTGAAWANITGATEDVDYTLSLGSGDLAGYTVLTVPEPATIGLLCVGGLMALVRKRR